MATKSKAVRAQFNDEDITEEAEAIRNAPVATKKPTFYMSVLPSHKSKAKYFTMMNDRVVVETMRNGVAGGDLSREQDSHFQYLKKRFPKYLTASTEMAGKEMSASKKLELAEKIRKINQSVGQTDKKLADEMVADLKKKYKA